MAAEWVTGSRLLVGAVPARDMLSKENGSRLSTLTGETSSS